MKIDVSMVLHFVIIVLLFIVVYQNETNETQILGWVQQYGARVESMENHLIKTDPTYVPIKLND